MKTLILVLLVVVLSACSKDETLDSMVQGDWTVEKGFSNGEWHDLSGQNITITVNETHISAPYNVDYTVSNDKELILSDGRVIMVCFINDGFMRWSFTDGTHLHLK